ncbi:MAG TPA: hypothetical protein VGO60_07875 [Iamia sp.]|nr:hypothetical protein [Iamia sp.]
MVLPLVAALPAVRATVRAVQVGWVPIADEGVIALRAHDVLTTRTPALGQMSLASAAAGAPTRSPGPLGYWVLAPAAQIGPLWLVAALAGALAAGALAATVHLAGRRGGIALMLPLTAGLVLSARAFDPVNLAVGWNPSIGLAPMALLVLLAWSVGVGERGWLPLTFAVASFLAQVHVTYTLPAIAAVAVAVAGGWGPDALGWLRGRRVGAAAATPPRRSARPLVLAAAVGAVLWAIPLAQQLTRHPGNLTLLSRSARGEVRGIEVAGHVLAWSVGLPPAFGRSHVGGLAILGRLDPPWCSLQVVSAVGVGIGLFALVVRGVRLRRRDIAIPPLVVLAVLASSSVALRSTPTDERGLSVGYTTWWLIPVGMLAWVVLVATGVRSSVRATALLGRLARRPGSRRGTGVAVLVAVVLMVAVALGTPIRDPEDHLYPVAEQVGDAVAGQVRDGQRYQVLQHGVLGLQLAPGIAYRIRRAGADPVIHGGDGVSAGAEYQRRGVRCAAVIGLTPLGPGEPVPRLEPGTELLRVVAVPPGPVVDATRVVVTWSVDAAEPSC